MIRMADRGNGKCGIYHDTVVVNRKEASDKITLPGRLSKEIAKMIAKHATYFEQFEKIISSSIAHMCRQSGKPVMLQRV